MKARVVTRCSWCYASEHTILQLPVTFVRNRDFEIPSLNSLELTYLALSKKRLPNILRKQLKIFSYKN